ncbi:MAG: lipopolysaccharide heptosyltransferase II [Chlamydiales bacterium]|nr:lipopolysaccharide heptosyltransferase II [Chlamydiales bacterium]
MQILARMPNWIGDAVMAIPSIHEIKHQYPYAVIDIIAKPAVLDLFLHDPCISKRLPFLQQDRKAIASQIRKQGYTHSILFTNSFSSAWQFFKWGLKNRIGFNNEWRRVFLHHAQNKPTQIEHMHLVDVYKMLLAFLDVTIQGFAPTLYVKESEKAVVKQQLKQMGLNLDQPIIGINPGAAYGLAKCWLPDQFHLVVKGLLDEYPSTQIIIFGDKSMQDLGNNIIGSLKERVYNLAGKTTMRELMAIISLCSVFLTNDSGPMHIASALSIPTVALFGSTNPTKTGPYKSGIVIQKKVACSPCYLKTCPIDFRCMKQIHAQEVINVIHKVIA